MPTLIRKTYPDLETVSGLIDAVDSHWRGRFQGLTLRTALQPIYSISHKRVVGYEALIRAQDPDGSIVPPPQLFSLPTDDNETVLLDRLCRYLHVRNFHELHDNINWLFLNVAPRTMALGTQFDSFFGGLLEALNFPAHRVVVEIVEQPADEPEQLAQTVNYYKSLGCLTAIDDFGAGHSNFERIWKLQPDIVKLDRQMLVRAHENARARRLLNGIASLLHQAGCLVLLEGVENEEQALIAVEAGVDFVQGYYFSRPNVDFSKLGGSDAVPIDSVLSTYKTRTRNHQDPLQAVAQYFSADMVGAISRLQSGLPLQAACRNLIDMGRVSRSYLIDTDGVQIGTTLLSDALAKRMDQRFKPLEDTHCADWFRQHYLQRAVRQPGQLQITRPYLSVSGANMCVTLSCCFATPDGMRVLCCDIITD